MCSAYGTPAFLTLEKNLKLNPNSNPNLNLKA